MIERALVTVALVLSVLMWAYAAVWMMLSLAIGAQS